MRKLAMLLGCLLFVPAAAQAQRFDVFAGYSFEQFDQIGSNARTNGWEGSLTYKFSPYLGLTGAFTGNYGTLLNESMSVHHIYAGPQISLPMRYSPFVHALFGDVRIGLATLHKNAFSTEIGGGLDIQVNHHLSIRAIEADVVTGNIKPTQSDGRICSGFVIHF